jgi:predicted dehydrogenase
MTKTNLGLIGVGYIGKIHLMNCLRLQNAQLTAVADTSKKALSAVKRLGITNTYRDYHELLNNPSIDAVIIALPTYLHAECAKAAAEKHKHILLEKPLARNTREGKDILSITSKYNVKLMIGYDLRFSAASQNIRTKIEKGELGKAQIAYATNISSGPFLHRAEADAPIPVPEWWWNKELTGGGALIDLGSHMINLVRWCFGEITDAKSYLGYRYNLEQEDHAVCTLKFNEGQIAIITVGWFSQQNQTKLEVYGTAGHAIASYNPPNKIKTAIQLMLKKTPSFHRPYLIEIQHFLDSIQKDQQPQPSGEDGFKDLEVIEKAYKNTIKLD